MNAKQVVSFRSAVWKFYRAHARHDLPWRKTKNPYRILVSEVMLQQTQVARVIEKYKEFLKTFPTIQVLARSPLSQVLKVWSGLGYNRRAKYLHDCAKTVVSEYKSNLRKALVHPLPGVGPYTRAAVLTFACNEPHTMIETNIRTTYIHHFFASRTTHDRIQDGKVSDGEILEIAAHAAEGQDPRTWHWALMDYGSYLKKSGVRNNSSSTHYTKQSKFAGSLRQVRGEIIKALSNSESIIDLRGQYGEKLDEALEGLARDGLIKKRRNTWKVV